MASCPNCGFDFDLEGRCPVCGFGPSPQDELEPVGLRAQSQGFVDSLAAGSGEVTDEASEVEETGRRGEADPTVGLVDPRERPLRPTRKVPSIAVGAAALFVLLAVGAFFLLGPVRGGSSAAGAATRGATATKGPFTAEAAAAALAAGGARTDGGGSPGEGRSAHGGRAGSGTTQSGQAGSKVAISRVGFSAPVGASPAGIRATHADDLYIPAKQPLYNITRRTAFPPLTSEGAYAKWMLAHTHQQEKFLRERWKRATIAVDHHLIAHKRVLMAFLLTPREWFVRPYNLPKTYENTALPIGYGQTISGPDLVAHMTDALDPRPNQRVLEIGTGSGYQSAVLSQLTNYVYTIEIVRPLAEQTNQIYLEHTKAMPQFANIHRRLADGYYGWPAYAPFDRIIVTTGIDHIPPILLQELKPGGIMVIPVGPPTGQTILKITKTVDKNGHIHLKRKNLYPGITDIFVPFTASGGGTHNTAK